MVANQSIDRLILNVFDEKKMEKIIQTSDERIDRLLSEKSLPCFKKSTLFSFWSVVDLKRSVDTWNWIEKWAIRLHWQWNQFHFDTFGRNFGLILFGLLGHDRIKVGERRRQRRTIDLTAKWLNRVNGRVLTLFMIKVDCSRTIITNETISLQLFLFLFKSNHKTGATRAGCTCTSNSGGSAFFGRNL